MPAASTILLNAIRGGNAQRIFGIIGWPGTPATQIGVSCPHRFWTGNSFPGGERERAGWDSRQLFRRHTIHQQQASELADTAAKQLNARRILIVADPNDPQGNAWATAFAARLSSQYASTVTLQRREPYDSTAPNDFNAIALDAANTNTDLIYFTGDNLGALNLAHALVSTARGTIRVSIASVDARSPSTGLGQGLQLIDRFRSRVIFSFRRPRKKLLFYDNACNLALSSCCSTHIVA